MFFDNKTLYPTPPELAAKMRRKLKNKCPQSVLEPSAGKADLIEGIFPRTSYDASPEKIACIEIDPTLQATLRGKGYKLIDSDFLSYSGWDKFSCIIANPPFDEGDKHLLKAIEIMYRGEIVFLINAETLRNPYTNTRKILVQKLKDLDADIEYIEGAFKSAERPTGVEIALVHIEVDHSEDSGLFDGIKDKAEDISESVSDKHDLSNGRTIQELVALYDETVRMGIEQAVSYFQNYPRIGKYLSLVTAGEASERYPDLSRSGKDRTAQLQDLTNKMLVEVRQDFWRRVLNLREVSSRMTSERQREFDHAMSTQCDMDFTEANIRQFVLNIIGSYESTLRKAVLEIFDRFTINHCYHGGVNEKNIHYFNGWKTNDAFKVGKRVIIPVYGSYGSAFFDEIFKQWSLNYGAAESLRDIDVVMNYFDGLSKYVSLNEAIQKAFSKREKRGESTYFHFVCHKKGTLHLTFKDENILRRFNVVACQEKGWLPQDYGAQNYEALSLEEKATVDSFEGEKSYSKGVQKPLFQGKSLLELAA